VSEINDKLNDLLLSSKSEVMEFKEAKNTLFPDEVLQYEPYLIREFLHNCIAHQDYALGGKINVIESEDDFLIFMNIGSFMP
jgi:ATP-dependent DNA helicase RecG